MNWHASDPWGDHYSQSGDGLMLVGPQPTVQGEAQGNSSVYLPRLAGYNPGVLLLGLAVALTAFGVWTSSISIHI